MSGPSPNFSITPEMRSEEGNQRTKGKKKNLEKQVYLLPASWKKCEMWYILNLNWIWHESCHESCHKSKSCVVRNGINLKGYSGIINGWSAGIICDVSYFCRITDRTQIFQVVSHLNYKAGIQLEFLLCIAQYSQKAQTFLSVFY